MSIIVHARVITEEEAIFALFSIVKNMSEGVIKQHEYENKKWFTFSTTVSNLKVETPSYLPKSIFGEQLDIIVIHIENSPAGLKSDNPDNIQIDYKPQISIEFLKK